MSTYSFTLISQLVGALENAEFTSADVTQLREFGRLADFRRVMRGELKLVEVNSQPIMVQQPLTWPEAMKKAYQLLGLQAEYTQFFDASNGYVGVHRCWTLLMVKGLTYPHLVQGYKAAGVTLELFGVDLEKAINPQEEQRDPNRDGSYLVSFKSNIEADPENANQSAHQHKQANCKDNTLAERLLLGLVYFLMTGKHLDIKNITLCTGSRDRDGYVPRVRWGAGAREVYVPWCVPDYRDDDLRARSVVS